MQESRGNVTAGAAAVPALVCVRAGTFIVGGLAEAHASLAFIKFRFDWDWTGAEAEFTRALALSPAMLRRGSGMRCFSRLAVGSMTRSRK
jgi:hypothetical protein